MSKKDIYPVRHTKMTGQFEVHEFECITRTMPDLLREVASWLEENDSSPLGIQLLPSTEETPTTLRVMVDSTNIN